MVTRPTVGSDEGHVFAGHEKGVGAHVDAGHHENRVASEIEGSDVSEETGASLRSNRFALLVRDDTPEL